MIDNRELKKILPGEAIKSRPIDRYAYARDAGFYHLIPQMVVQPRTLADIAGLFKLAESRKRVLVFRAGGTSLSGQSVSDDILVEINKNWRNVKIRDEGRSIEMGAAVVGAHANRMLESYGRRIGPDPGSINAAFIAGIVANNASGIGPGILYNAYNTLESIELVLPNGFTLNTADNDAEQRLKTRASHIYQGLADIRKTILASTELSHRIQKKYQIKNTMGYSLNAFLDYEKPVDILAHLMVGSEGTLGFISKVSLRTVALKAYKATALLLFENLHSAAHVVPDLKGLGAYALEIMDYASLRAVRHVHGLPKELSEDLPPGTAALLVEFQAESSQQRKEMTSRALEILKKVPLLHPATFSARHDRQEILWKVRRELGPYHAATRKPGTTILSEDICFHPQDLANAIRDLQAMFKTFGYDDAVIFGHAGDGNIHFKLSVDLSRKGDRSTYRVFMDQLATLVIDRYQGSLKAEHGTGRNMAPFLEREWGKEARDIMVRIKKLFDPAGILNPDVIISDDPLIHLRNIKSFPAVDSEVDACIECGLCEPWCPSADLTLSPRRRIALLREIKLLENGSHHQPFLAHQLKHAFRYAGIETCATDGLCAVSCPIDIDTGALMKTYRAQMRSSFSLALSLFVQKHLSVVLRGLRVFLLFIRPLTVLSERDGIQRMSRMMNRLSHRFLPAWNHFLIHAPDKLPAIRASKKAPDLEVVYFPSCLTRSIGDPPTDTVGPTQTEALLAIFEKARIKVTYPDRVSELCCGLSFSSKGLIDASLQAAIRTTEMLWLASRGGEIPIVMDTSPCSRYLKQYDTLLSGVHLARWRQLAIYDITEYLHDVVLERLELKPVPGEAVLHVTCSTIGMELDKKLETVARACAENVVVPYHNGCCGFAGDRGLFIPELTEQATINEASEVHSCKGDAGYYSTSRTCEIALSQATGETYRSLVHLVYQAMK